MMEYLKLPREANSNFFDAKFTLRISPFIITAPTYQQGSNPTGPTSIVQNSEFGLI